jgi:diguanylate cyclase (GGDEF)-like protein/PAS domain S-box-containing protein
MSGARYSQEQLEAQIHGLLERHPDATVFAIEPGNYDVVGRDHPGVADLIAVGVEVLGPVGALDLLHPDSRAPALTAIDRVAPTGVVCDHLFGVDGSPVESYLFDTMARRKVYIGLQVPGSGPVAAPATTARDVLPGRVTRLGTDGLGRVLWIDDAGRNVLDEVEEQVVGSLSMETVHPDDYDQVRLGWAEMLANPDVVHRMRFRRRIGDGWRWFDTSMTNRLADPERPEVALEVVDISREMEAQDEIMRRERLLDRLAEALPQAIVQFDRNGSVIYSNRLVGELFGGRLETVEPLVSAAEPDCQEDLASALDEALRGGDQDLELQLSVPGRSQSLIAEIVLRGLSDPDGSPDGVICCISDVTERARLRESLEIRATFDLLTGLHNRESTIRALEAAVLDASQDGTRPVGVAAIFVDLDGFKTVNDSFGHAVGDQVLRGVAARLKKAVRGRDVVGRLGGDEFLIVCHEVEDADAALAAAHRIASTLRSSTGQEDPLQGTSASVGVSWTRGDHDADLLMARADQAMYEAKRSGEGRPVLAP